jgi:dihydrofolate reductase
MTREIAMKLSILVALSENGVIGRKGQLPWRLPDELQFVKRTTMGHTVLMGRKTYESIGRPLPGRTSIVLSRDASYAPNPEVIVAASLDEGLDVAKQSGESETFVFGGESVYAAALSIADRLYLTRVHCDLEGDARFPAFEPEEWKLVSEELHERDERHPYSFTYQTLDRIR